MVGCGLVTAPTGLERTQDIHNGTVAARSHGPGGPGVTHSAPSIFGPQSARRTCARRTLRPRPYAHWSGAPGVTGPMRKNGNARRHRRAKNQKMQEARDATIHSSRGTHVTTRQRNEENKTRLISYTHTQASPRAAPESVGALIGFIDLAQSPSATALHRPGSQSSPARTPIPSTHSKQQAPPPLRARPPQTGATVISCSSGSARTRRRHPSKSVMFCLSS